MKKKDVAGILAIILGGFGVHQFYLGNTGKGIFHLFLTFAGVGTFGGTAGISWLIGWITGIMILSMGREQFDRKYNQRYSKTQYDDYEYTRNFNHQYKRKEYRGNRGLNKRERRKDDFERELEKRWKYPQSERRRPEKKAPQKPRRKPNPHKQRGIRKYKEYDYDAAIEEFHKSLAIEPEDIATHFNLSCAYSLNEDADKAFYHLDKAVEYGLKDHSKIKDHDALAYLRIQKEFDTFESNGYRLVDKKTEATQEKEPATSNEEDLLSTQPDLLDQLKKLGELRERGLLTEDEFAEQKRKLLR